MFLNTDKDPFHSALCYKSTKPNAEWEYLRSFYYTRFSKLTLLSNCFYIFAGSYPKAQNVTWKSNNFKTFLTWEPEPSADYSYTVEYSV